MNCKPEFGFEKKDRPMDQTDLTVCPKKTICVVKWKDYVFCSKD